MAPKGRKRPASEDARAVAKRANTAGSGGDPAALSASAAAAVRELTASLVDKTWRDALEPEFSKPYFAEIAQFVAQERKGHLVHPAPDKVFAALNVTPLANVKVVIIGQDPYHEPGQAHGLCFSVLPGVKTPPSLVNMYKELEGDVAGFKAPDHGYLMDWAKQGVLMLNATLTVRGGHTEANSHSKCGWQKFTDEVIRVLNARKEGVVFLLWGGFAQKKGKIIDSSKHIVIESAHPSPLSVTKWRGCKTFSKCNAALKSKGKGEINWLLGPASAGKAKADVRSMLGAKKK